MGGGGEIIPVGDVFLSCRSNKSNEFTLKYY